MKSVLRSIKPYWFCLICEGKKTIEVGKDCPKATDWNRTVELYCSKDMKSFNRIPKEYQEKYRKYLGKVGARFVCDKINEYTFSVYDMRYRATHVEQEAMCLYQPELLRYGNDKPLYGWHISDLQIYDKPKELSEFKTPPCEKSEKACGNCKWLVKIDTPDMYEVDCFVENGRPITRPPQSYMFVKEL